MSETTRGVPAVLRILRRRYAVILACFLVALASALALSLTQEKKYTATARCSSATRVSTRSCSDPGLHARYRPGPGGGHERHAGHARHGCRAHGQAPPQGGTGQGQDQREGEGSVEHRRDRGHRPQSAHGRPDRQHVRPRVHRVPPRGRPGQDRELPRPRCGAGWRGFLSSNATARKRAPWAVGSSSSRPSRRCRRAMRSSPRRRRSPRRPFAAGCAQHGARRTARPGAGRWACLPARARRPPHPGSKGDRADLQAPLPGR